MEVESKENNRKRHTNNKRNNFRFNFLMFTPFMLLVSEKMKEYQGKVVNDQQQSISTVDYMDVLWLCDYIPRFNTCWWSSLDSILSFLWAVAGPLESYLWCMRSCPGIFLDPLQMPFVSVLLTFGSKMNSQDLCYLRFLLQSCLHFQSLIDSFSSVDQGWEDVDVFTVVFPFFLLDFLIFIPAHAKLPKKRNGSGWAMRMMSRSPSHETLTACLSFQTKNGMQGRSC